MVYQRAGWLGAAVTAVVLATALPARAELAASPWFETEQGEVRLLAAQPAITADNAVELGLEFRLEPHWKIYWRSPGDAGYPPRLDWTGSRNLKSAQVEWPAPQRFSVLGLETVGYTGTIVLPIIARLNEAGTPLALRLGLDYLTCSEICIPYRTTLTLDLPAGPPAAGATGFGALIARYAAQVPSDGRSAGVTVTGATWRPGRAGRLELAVTSDPPLVAPDAFIEGAGAVVFGAPRTVAGAGPGEAVLRLNASGAPAALAALPGRNLTVTLVDGGRAMEAVVTPVLGSPAVDLAALLPMLAVALLGGLILNIMPCVLPVLALKLVGAISHAGRSQGSVRRGFLATAGGILLSFLALALAAIGLRSAGIAVGWGIQFQDPLFLAAMAALLTLFAANLWGLFEVPLPETLTGLAGRARGEGLLGSVATGAFATLLATPCSAPFLGTAIGFALAAGPVEILAIFFALGLGFAAPYLLVAAVPRLALALPRPGRWMVALRRILGVALGVSALWLLWVLAAETGADAGLAIAALLAAAVAALALLRTPMARRGAVAATLLAALLVPVAAPRVVPRASHDAFWHPFDQAAIGELVRDGHVVFVDVSAEWCLTCKVNERLVLDSAPVRDRLAAPVIVPMRADWTRPDAAIANYLRGFGRYGIPFNAVYGPGAPSGLVLPEILTAERVVAALRRAETRVVASGR